jgi:hypothetical protein
MASKPKLVQVNETVRAEQFFLAHFNAVAKSDY